MPKKTLLFVLFCLGISIACAISPLAGSPGQPTSAPGDAVTVEQPMETHGSPPATGRLAPATPPASEGRSAGIDLLPGSSGTPTPNIPPTLAAQPMLPLQPDEWYPLNATQESGDFSVTVLGWGIPGKEETVQADPGFKFIWIDVVLYNHGSPYLLFYPGMQATLKDEAGKEYSLNDLVFRYENDSAGNANIAPGEHLRHEFYFTVPENFSPLTFHYDICSGNSGSCGEPIQIPLAKAPASAQAPAEINAPDPATHAMGEVITLGQQAFSVIRWQVAPPSGQPRPGADYSKGINLVQVNIVLANLDQQAMKTDATSGLWINLKDKTGRYYKVDTWGFGGLGQLEPGEWQQGYYTFEVPPGVEGLELVFDSGPVKKWPALTRTFVSLGDQPALDLSALEKMPGSIAPNPVPLGQPGQVGSFQVTVQKVDFPNTSACGDIQPGYRAILVTASGVNRSSSKVLTTPLETFLKDSHGNQYTACDTKNDSIAAGGLEPDATMNLVYSFLVPDFPGEIDLVQHILAEDGPKVFFTLK